jgi:hypothetical protein
LSGDGGRLYPDIRGAFGKFVKKAYWSPVSQNSLATPGALCTVAKTRKAIGKRILKDKPRKPTPAKITEQVELSILKLRTTFKCGTSRNQQGLYKLPD